jgi:DNA-binding IclR family transcriptional regulator
MPNSKEPGDPTHAAGAATSVTPVERKSPPTRRVVQVLDLLADRPRERFTLTRVADVLGLNKPTCLGILTALVDAQYLTRDEAKTYGLGPALVRLGSAAETGLANLDVVRPFLVELHDRLGLTCVLSAVYDRQIVILDRLGTAIPGDRRDLIGERFPLAPPLGLVNIAWAHESVIDEWLARPPLVPIAPGARPVREIVAAGLADGYIVECLRTSSSSSVVLASLLASDLPPRMVDELRQHLPPEDWSEFVTALGDDGAAALPVANISAPVYDRQGTQQYTLTVVPESPDATVALARQWGEAVARAGAAASAALGGR